MWKPFAKNKHVYVTYVDVPRETFESLNEVREYLGNTGEYGGWITKDKVVYPVAPYSHHNWVSDRYGTDLETGHVESYDAAFEDGAIRYLLGKNGLELNGYVDAIKALFNIWWPTAIRKDSVLIEPELNQNEKPWHDQYQMPEHKQHLLNKWRPGHPTRAMAKKMGIGESILNELKEYINLEDEYGGWITKDKKVHTVEQFGHIRWVEKIYNSDNYSTAFEDGNVRYYIGRRHGQDLSLQGHAKDIANTFFVWWPTASQSDEVYIDSLEDDSRIDGRYTMPSQKAELRALFRKPKPKNDEPVIAPQGGKWWHENPGVKVESIQLNELREYLGLEDEYGGWITKDKEVQTEKFKPKRKDHRGAPVVETGGFYDQDKRKDRSLGAGYTVSIFKHEVNNLDEDKWNESVQKIKDVKSGMSCQGALKLQRKIIDELQSRNVHNENGWTDYFTRIQEDDLNETEGGTVGHMFRGGYESGMRSTAKNTKNRKPMSPFSKINEKYNTNSTWLKVGKNIVEVVLNKVTRRIKRGNKITEVEIPTYKIFVDGVDVGHVDNIDEMFFVKNDKTFDRYDSLEEAISKVMGPSYYDGKGSTEFVQYNPDPYSLNV